MVKYDAIIIGSGPNGLAAAITMQQYGLSTLLVEGASTVGGGMRTKELITSGCIHDVCSTVHPMFMGSPFFRSLPLSDYGLEFIKAPLSAAHPLDSGDASFLYNSLNETARDLGIDGKLYTRLIRPIVNQWETLALNIMGPLNFSQKPVQLAMFGLKAIISADWMSFAFKTEKGKALWAGMAAHAIQPFSNWTTSSIGIILMAMANKYGWLLPKGGSQSIADTLLRYYQHLGGRVTVNWWVKDKRELPEHKVLILTSTPKQILEMQGLNLSQGYLKQLVRYRYGMGIFKLDWVLSEPVPFLNKRCGEASTVHLGNTYSEISLSEKLTHQGKLVDRPFVLLTQPTQFDKTRSSKGKHVAWAYCHVPNGSTDDRTTAIEEQIERFAPGFKDTIIGRSKFNSEDLEKYNPNYVGGDINGGIMDIYQLYTRPTCSLTPYNTSNKFVYICSSATPPGGGVHGMNGYHAAQKALKDHFGL